MRTSPIGGHVCFILLEPKPPFGGPFGGGRQKKKNGFAYFFL
jgi:hypothetical protein